MSYHIFFDFSTGLSKTINVPVGTLKSINNHVANVESKLKIKRTKYLDNPEHWATDNFKEIDNKLLCETALEHNDFIRTLYSDFENWSKNPPKKHEKITPKQAEYFFVGLHNITVPPDKWTADYYNNRMETIYEVMRGRETDGISFNEKPLTKKQAGAIIGLFAEFLDNDDLRLDVPEGHDYLASSSDGGYDWCVMRGAVLWEDADIDEYKCKKCKYNDDCPLYEEMKEEINDEM